MASKRSNTSAMAATKKKNKKKTKHTLSDLKTLGTELLSSRSHINNLPLLLSYINPSSPPNYLVEALLSLQSFLSPLLPSLPTAASASTAVADVADPEVIYRTWLRAKFDELVVALMEIVVSSQCEDTLREVVLDTLMEFIKLGNGGKFNSSLYNKLIQAIVCFSVEVDFLLESLSSSYFKYIDVSYFTFITVEKLCKTLESKNISADKNVAEGDDSKNSLEGSIKKIHFILSHIPSLGNLTSVETWSSGFLSKDNDNQEECEKDEKIAKNQSDSTKNELSLSRISKKMKLKFTKAWMTFLRLPLPLEVYKEVLANMHQTVIPFLSNPAMLCDFLTRSYDIGGVVSVMALSGLFILMTKYGLEYPNFYEKLYALLIPSIFMAKHRAKFFELLDACLKSPLLPAYLAAAFTKKLSRLSLQVPPSGALVIIALVHNLLRRHPSINCLVHQEISEETKLNDTTSSEEPVKADTDAAVVSEREEPGIDLFNDEEDDLKKSNAMRSSLWEIDTLRHHYCPPVSRFVLSLENDLTVRSKTTEVTVSDFSSGSYSTIFREEMRRRVKQVPLAFYKAMPTALFSESDFPGWTFNYEEAKVA
ncbi:protein NUCLEOLAR COMPLEX ASSOCIATED 4 [Silene latifolia]|uniref:protein NUCLEOLAR COMPLEX ASSOCIATED 4 n=1 Tax=Silene latifolia TaxID=37657 RepID=UPI003D77AA6D